MNPFTTNLARLDTVRAARDNELELRALAARFSKSSDEQVEPLCRMEPSEVHDERMARRYPALNAQIWVRADLAALSERERLTVRILFGVTRQWFVVNDRYGTLPLYWSRNTEGFAMSSTVRAVLTSDWGIERLMSLARREGIASLIREKANFDWHRGLISAVLQNTTVGRILGAA